MTMTTKVRNRESLDGVEIAADKNEQYEGSFIIDATRIENESEEIVSRRGNRKPGTGTFSLRFQSLELSFLHRPS